MTKTINKPLPEVIERVNCPTCRHFIGVITDDGHGPIFDQCNLSALKRVADKEVAALVRNGKYEQARAVCAERHLSPEPCPMFEKLSRFQPRLRPTCLGNAGSHAGPLDPDSGGYQAIARRAMEDGND